MIHWPLDVQSVSGKELRKTPLYETPQPDSNHNLHRSAAKSNENVLHRAEDLGFLFNPSLSLLHTFDKKYRREGLRREGLRM